MLGLKSINSVKGTTVAVEMVSVNDTTYLITTEKESKTMPQLNDKTTTTAGIQRTL